MVKRCVQQQTFLVIKPTTACVQQELHICFKQECLRSWFSKGLDNAHWRQYEHTTTEQQRAVCQIVSVDNGETCKNFSIKTQKSSTTCSVSYTWPKPAMQQNSTSSTHEFWWVQCCHLSQVQFSLCSISCYHPAYYSCWQAWGQHQWYWLGDFHQWLLNTVDFLCIVLHCAIMLTFTLLHYSVLGFCMVTFGNWICNTANWVNKLIINYVPMLISRYKQQHLIIHQLPTLTTGSNIPHTCGGVLAHLWVHNKHSNHLYSNGK